MHVPTSAMPVPISTISLNTIQEACANAGIALANTGFGPMWNNQNSRSGSWDSVCLRRCMCQFWAFPWVQSKMHVPLSAMHKPTSAVALGGTIKILELDLGIQPAFEDACGNISNFHEYNRRCMCQRRQCISQRRLWSYVARKAHPGPERPPKFLVLLRY